MTDKKSHDAQAFFYLNICAIRSMAFSSRIAFAFDDVENGCPELAKHQIACVWIHSISENAAAAASLEDVVDC